MTDEKEKEENCSVCKIAVAAGMALNICKKFENKEKCDELFDKLVKEDISPKELFDLIREKAKNNKDDLELLDYIVELAGGLEEDDEPQG